MVTQNERFQVVRPRYHGSNQWNSFGRCLGDVFHCTVMRRVKKWLVLVSGVVEGPAGMKPGTVQYVAPPWKIF